MEKFIYNKKIKTSFIEYILYYKTSFIKYILYNINSFINIYYTIKFHLI